MTFNPYSYFIHFIEYCLGYLLVPFEFIDKYNGFFGVVVASLALYWAYRLFLQTRRQVTLFETANTQTQKRADRSIELTEKSIVLTEKNLKDTQKNFELQNRAFLTLPEARFKTFKEGHKLFLVVVVENTGNTPALDVEIYTDIMLLNFKVDTPPPFSGEPIRTEIGAKSTIEATYNTEEPITNIVDYEKGKKFMYYYGYIIYKSFDKMFLKNFFYYRDFEINKFREMSGHNSST